jgi:phospholipase/carboxylesterase
MALAFKRLRVGLAAGLWACSAPQPGASQERAAAAVSTPATHTAQAPLTGPLPAAVRPAPAQPPSAAADPSAAHPSQPMAAAPAEPLADALPDETGWGVAAGLKYLELVRGDAKPDEKLPLLIVIHGLGDAPDRDWLQAIDIDPKLEARMILPQAPTAHGPGFAWFPIRFQDRDEPGLARGISAAEERLVKLIEKVRVQRPTRGRAVVCGFSQGGMLSYALALAHPKLVQFALPISGELPHPLWPSAGPKKAYTPRILALHGTADAIVSFDADVNTARHLRELGYPVELVPFEGASHTISAEMSARAKQELSAAIRSLR